METYDNSDLRWLNLARSCVTRYIERQQFTTSEAVTRPNDSRKIDREFFIPTKKTTTRSENGKEQQWPHFRTYFNNFFQVFSEKTYCIKNWNWGRKRERPWNFREKLSLDLFSTVKNDGDIYDFLSANQDACVQPHNSCRAFSLALRKSLISLPV